MAERLNATARDLEADLAWLAALLQHRLDTYFAEKPASPALPGERPPPMLADSPSPYAEFLRRHALTADERAVLLLALAPSLRPQLLDVLWARNPANQRGYSEFGGVQGASSGHFIPTGETACFLLAGDHLAERLRVIHLLADRDSLLTGEVLLPLVPPPGEGMLAARLQPAPALLALFGLDAPGGEADALPAQRVTTGLTWADLVLPPATLARLEEVRDWLIHGDTLLHVWGMLSRLRPGYTCLFHGPPGTGKTLSACLLGKLCEREVHRVDLSMVVSKYIGETEKNLARVFDLAEQRGWILFFDEADALFGQRTRVDSAHDRYANQEVSYLLQRMEAYHGLAILTTNLKSSLDPAFLRRLRFIVHFPFPDQAQRLALWQRVFPAGTPTRELDFEKLSRLSMTGGSIRNIALNAAFLAADDGEPVMMRHLLQASHAEASKRERPLADAETRGWL